LHWVDQVDCDGADACWLSTCPAVACVLLAVSINLPPDAGLLLQAGAIAIVCAGLEVTVRHPGSEPERFGHSLGQIILGHRGVDRDDRQFQPPRFPARAFGEHPIAFEQVVQGPLRT
jgi:hypothetical protein